MDLYLIRHTEVNISPGICYGHSDIEVLESPLNQTLERLLTLLPQNSTVYSSPLIRCAFLARKIAGQAIYDSRLMEMNFGNWELKAWNEIAATELTPWMDDFVHVTVPGGESFKGLNDRTNEFLQDLIANEQENVITVTHAGVIRSLLCQVLDI